MRGGAREGAGRKKLAHEEKRLTVALRVRSSYKEWLYDQAETQGVSIGKIVELLIDEFKDE